MSARSRRKQKKTERQSAPVPPSTFTTRVLPAILIVFGALLILICARGDLWFDEILSFQWARNAKSPADLLSLFRHDNNHPLNTFWIMLVGDGHPPLVYRLLSIISGIASLVLIHRIGVTMAPSGGWVPLLLSATSFPLVLYFSEARGYAPAVACALGIFLILLKADHRPAWFSILLFWILCLAGMLAHGTFLYILAALGIWYFFRAITTGRKFSEAAVTGAVWFAVPAMLSIGYYLYFLRPMMIAGGPEYSIPTVLGHFLGYALGLPTGGYFVAFTFVVSAALLVAAVVLTAKDGRRLWLLFLLILVVMPAAALLITGAKFLYFRYFLVCMPFVYLLTGPLAEFVQSSRSRGLKLGACLLLVVFLAGQVPRLAGLVQFGRGSYSAALDFLIRSPVAGKTVFSDQDLRNGMVFEFYRKGSRSSEGLRYIPQWEHPSAPATWLITHSQDPLPLNPPPFVSLFGGNYRLQKIFPSGPVSGTHWFLYLLEPADTTGRFFQHTP